MQQISLTETTFLHPRSPYTLAKMQAYWCILYHRETYGIYAFNDMLFNYESPPYGKTFITRKITRSLATVAQGLALCLFIGNIDALRD